MNITRDVIKDLLPLYVAGEVSDDTRRLVDEYLRNDPELARMAAEDHSETAIPRLTKEDEMNALVRTRSLLHRLRVAQGLAIFFTLLPLSVRLGGGDTQFVFAQAPQFVVPMAIVALFAWAGYFWYRSRVAATGL